MKIFSKILLTMSLSLLSFGVFSQVESAQPRIFDFSLKNGLKLIVKTDHRSPVVISSVWYKVGGSYEHNGLTGISHVLEHMMFRGTKKHGPGELEKLISRVGGQQNAMTGTDFTMYYQLLPVNQLRLSFKLEADRMHNLLLTKKDFDKEIQVVMEERRMRVDDNPQALTWERFLAAAFVNNPYHHPTVGWMTDLKNMTEANVSAWYHLWYQPNNAIVVVVGDVEPQKVLQLANQYFGKIKAKTVPKLKPRTEIPQLGVKWLHVKVPAKLSLLFTGYQTPSIRTAVQAWQPFALDVLANVLGGSNSSRLQNDLIRNQGLVSSVSVDYNPFNLHSNVLQIIALPSPGHTVKEVQQAILKEIERLKTERISKDEFARIKTQMIASKIYSQDSLSQQAMLLGTPEAVGLPWKLGENYIHYVDRVTRDQIQQVAKQLLIEKALTVAVLQPLPTEKPQRTTLNVNKTLSH